MRTTDQRSFWLDPLSPRGIYLFLALVMLWIAWSFVPPQEETLFRIAARVAGYVAFVAMLVPYVHILQRGLRSYPGRMSSWLRWHIASSYAAFFFLLLHSEARASSLLTGILLWLAWGVMISGVIGFYGQKLLFFLLPRLKDAPREFGLERLEPERVGLLKSGEASLPELEETSAEGAVKNFVTTAVTSCLAQPFNFRTWIWRRLQRRKATTEQPDESQYAQALLLATDGQAKIVQNIWNLVATRRQLNREYALHQLGRLWLFVHGPLAWALLVLMIEHVIVSLWYGGF
jgi:hypothetical protein